MAVDTEMIPVEGQKKEWRPEERQDSDSKYEEFSDYDDDEALDSDMEGSIIDRSGPKKKVKAAPPLPKRSDKRTSKILESAILELKTLDGSTSKEAEQSYIAEDPQELYLSSEEDASISDYDSLEDFESASEDIAEEITYIQTHTRSRSQEDTAKLVQLMHVSKPQIIEIHISSHSAPVSRNTSPSTPVQKRASLDLSSLAAAIPQTIQQRPPPLKIQATASIHRLSVSSIASTSSQYSTNSQLQTTKVTPTKQPHRKSKLTTLTSLITKNPSQPQIPQTYSTSYIAPSTTTAYPFLSSLPSSPPPPQSPTEPKTPTSQWKRSLLSKAAAMRRPSVPKLSFAYNAAAAGQPSSRTASMSRIDLVEGGGQNGRAVMSAVEGVSRGLGIDVAEGKEEQRGQWQKPGPVRRSATMPIPVTPTFPPPEQETSPSPPSSKTNPISVPSHNPSKQQPQSRTSQPPPPQPLFKPKEIRQSQNQNQTQTQSQKTTYEDIIRSAIHAPPPPPPSPTTTVAPQKPITPGLGGFGNIFGRGRRKSLKSGNFGGFR